MLLPLTIPDLVCEADLDPFATETTSDLQTLTQDVYHILKEFPGSNPDDPDRGIGVETYLSGTADALRTLPGLIQHQLLVDPRIDTCTATVTQTDDDKFALQILLGVNATVVPLLFGWSNGSFTNLTP